MRRIEGIDDIAAKVAKGLTSLGSQLVVPGVDPATISDALDRSARLRPIEDALYPYYRRAYENRLEADSDAMRGVLKVWRVVQASGDRGLIERFQFLGDWIGRHHGHGTRDTAQPAAATAAAK